MPTNLSTPEIARELSMSVHTVRTHIRHLFAKLGVHGRTEAVARARALGLLAPPASPHAPWRLTLGPGTPRNRPLAGPACPSRRLWRHRQQMLASTGGHHVPWA